MRHLRFGVQVSELTTDIESLVKLAQRAEALGFSSIFLPDHLGGDQWSPISALTAIALGTKEISLGALVFCNDYRHPVVLAQELACLSVISSGRLEFGLGAGWMKADYERAGIAMDSPSKRIARLEEALIVMKGLFLGSAFSYFGEYYQLENASTITIPEGMAPKLIVGGGGKKMLEVASRHGDVVGVNVNLASGAVGPSLVAEVGPDAFDEKLKWVNSYMGDRIGEVDLQCLSFIAKVGPDANDWIDSMAPAFGISGKEAREIPIVLSGTVDQVAETILARRREYGFNYWVIHQNELEEFAPVVAALQGE